MFEMQGLGYHTSMLKRASAKTEPRAVVSNDGIAKVKLVYLITLLFFVAAADGQNINQSTNNGAILPTTSAAATNSPPVDHSTLYGKVMCGYQGWFGAPGDGSPDNSWHHWTKSAGPLADGHAKIDLWPETSELSLAERFQTDFKLSERRPAELFSSYVKPTVLRHFRWMQDYLGATSIGQFEVGLKTFR